MKYVLIFLFLAGFVGSALGQNIGDGSDKIWLPSCPIGTGTECDKSSMFPNPISGPFSQSDSVAVGTIIEKESLDQGSIKYSLSVDFYLKNYQPFDLITATLIDAPEPQTLPEVFWYNSPVFNEGDLVFVYLKKIDGGYRLLPESFALDKHEVRGPPPTIQMVKGPSGEAFEQGEKITVSGEVRKLELVIAAKNGKQLDVKFTLVESPDRDSVVFSDIVKIGYDGNYNYSLDTSKIPSGNYELELNYGPSTYSHGITITPNFKIWTPQKQFSFGIPVEEIQCKENLVLIQKYDGSPACVKPETKQKLIERGWTGIKLTTKSLLERYGDLPEVKAFYETYEDAQASIKEDHVSYFSGSDDGYFARMNLFFDKNYSLKNIDFHCYFQRTHQYEFPQEDVLSKITKFDCKEHGKTAGSEPEPMPEPESAMETQLRTAKKALESAYDKRVNLGNFYLKDVIVGYGTTDKTLVIDIPLKYMESDSIRTIKRDIQYIVGNDVPIDYVLYDEPIERHIETAVPYLWNQFLNKHGIDYAPKEQSYFNEDDGFHDPDRVCSPIVTSDGSDLYISSTFTLEPFQITGTYVDKEKPDDCHKIWKTDTIMVEPDRVIMLWLKNQNLENEN